MSSLSDLYQQRDVEAAQAAVELKTEELKPAPDAARVAILQRYLAAAERARSDAKEVYTASRSAPAPTGPALAKIETKRLKLLRQSTDDQDVIASSGSLPFLLGSSKMIFIRNCYTRWFGLFIKAYRDTGQSMHALSSTPGCGKTTAVIFILKMMLHTDELKDRPMIYHIGHMFFHITSNWEAFTMSEDQAVQFIEDNEDAFYVIDGTNTKPLFPARCLNLFISSPRNPHFRKWHVERQISPLYLPVWSLKEIEQCRSKCYPSIPEQMVFDRYAKYGGVARFIFFSTTGVIPSIDDAITDANARSTITSVNESTLIYPNSHMLLHIVPDDDMNFSHLDIASDYVGGQLFLKYRKDTLIQLQEVLGAGGAIAGHLFECFGHAVFEQGLGGSQKRLQCRSLEGDNQTLTFSISSHVVETFHDLPNHLDQGYYYQPLYGSFPLIDALTDVAAYQYTVSSSHPLRGSTKKANAIASLYPNIKIPYVFIVPSNMIENFKKQPNPKNFPVHQFVAGLKVGIQTMASRKRSLDQE